VNQIDGVPLVVMHISYMGRRQSVAPPNLTNPQQISSSSGWQLTMPLES